MCEYSTRATRLPGGGARAGGGGGHTLIEIKILPLVNVEQVNPFNTEVKIIIFRL